MKQRELQEWEFWLNKGSHVLVTYRLLSKDFLDIIIAVLQGKQSYLDWIADPTNPSAAVELQMIHVKAIETPDGEDDSQWLTYWILYSLMALIELALGKILVWMPFYSVASLLAGLYCLNFEAQLVYEVYVRNYLLSKPRRDSDPHSSREHLLRAVSPEARFAIVQYISDNGSDSFTKTIGASKWMYKMKSRRSH